MKIKKATLTKLFYFFVMRVLYTLALCARAETRADWVRVQAEFENVNSGFILESTDKAVFLAGEHLVPDVDIEFLLATWAEDDPCEKMSQVVNLLYDAIEAVDDTHVLFQSLNYKDLYTGKRRSLSHLNYLEDDSRAGLTERLVPIDQYRSIAAKQK